MERRRILMQSQVLPPPGYRFIEYAENNGNAYVTLPYGFDITDVVEVKGNCIHSFGDKYMVAPMQWNDNHNRFSMLGGISGIYVFSLGDQGTPNTLLQPRVPEDHDVHVCRYADKKFYMLDVGSVADMTSVTFGATTKPLRIFYGYVGTTRGRIYYFIQKKANGDRLNILPIQNIETGTVEMYDTVSKTIMERANSLSAPE